MDKTNQGGGDSEWKKKRVSKIHSNFSETLKPSQFCVFPAILWLKSRFSFGLLTKIAFFFDLLTKIALYLRSFHENRIFFFFWRKSHFLWSFHENRVFSAIFRRKTHFSFDLFTSHFLRSFDETCIFLRSFDENHVFSRDLLTKIIFFTASFGNNCIFSHDLLTKITLLPRSVNDNCLFPAILFYFFTPHFKLIFQISDLFFPPNVTIS